MARANAFWPTAVVGEADRVNSVSASACHIGEPKALALARRRYSTVHCGGYLKIITLYFVLFFILTFIYT